MLRIAVLSKSRLIGQNAASNRLFVGRAGVEYNKGRMREVSFSGVVMDPDFFLYMDKLTLFGLFSVTAMLVFYALEPRSRWFTLAFAGSCVLGSVYGFLQGAWPFGLVEAVWSLVALRRWWLAGT